MSGNQNGRSGEQNGEARQDCFSQYSRNVSKLRTEPFPPPFYMLLVLLISMGVEVNSIASNMVGLQFSVKGSSTISKFDSDGRLLETTRSEFTLHTKDCVWNWESRAYLDQLESRAFVGFDLTNIYTVVIGGGTHGGKSFDQIAQIQPGAIPQFGSHGALFWLTYLSRCVLKEDQREFRPVFQGYDSTGMVKVGISLTKPYHFPERIDFFSNADGGRKQITNGVFTIDEFSEQNGIQLPSRSTLLVFLINQDETSDGSLSNRVYLAEKQQLVTDRFLDDTPGTFVPPLGGIPTMINDRRLDSEYGPLSGVRYLSTNWLSVDEATLKAESREYAMQSIKRKANGVDSRGSGSSKPMYPRGNHWLLALVLFTFVVPLIVIWRLHQKHKPKKVR